MGAPSHRSRSGQQLWGPDSVVLAGRNAVGDIEGRECRVFFFLEYEFFLVFLETYEVLSANLLSNTIVYFAIAIIR